jgi:hypothetical protein
MQIQSVITISREGKFSGALIQYRFYCQGLITTDSKNLMRDVTKKSTFRDVMPCILVEVYRNFGGTFCSLLQGRSWSHSVAPGRRNTSTSLKVVRAHCREKSEKRMLCYYFHAFRLYYVY